MKEFDYLQSVFLLSEAIEACPNLFDGSEKLQQARTSALIQAVKTSGWFLQNGIREDIVRPAFAKKVRLISNASSVTEVNEIMRGPRPQYYGGKFIPGPYDVTEEELIMWSIASLHAPLNRAGFERYMTLFREVIGDIFDPSEAEVM